MGISLFAHLKSKIRTISYLSVTTGFRQRQYDSVLEDYRVFEAIIGYRKIELGCCSTVHRWIPLSCRFSVSLQV
jgi:hypothetical protein